MRLNFILFFWSHFEPGNSGFRSGYSRITRILRVYLWILRTGMNVAPLFSSGVRVHASAIEDDLGGRQRWQSCARPPLQAYPRALALFLPFNPSSSSGRHRRARAARRSRSKITSFPPRASNPPQPRFNHLVSYLLHPSNRSPNLHLAGNRGISGRRSPERPKDTSTSNSHLRPPFSLPSGSD